MKSLFNEFSLQRSKFAGELQNEAISLGEHDPEDSSSTAGAMHRAWINLKSAITSGDDHAILAECERGEDSAVAEYKKAMEDEDLSAPIRETISRQFTRGEKRARSHQSVARRDENVAKSFLIHSLKGAALRRPFFFCSGGALSPPRCQNVEWPAAPAGRCNRHSLMCYVRRC